jgi:mercuric ion transport protein
MTGRWSTRVTLAAPGVMAAAVASLGCPSCWPAYAALLSTLGLGWLLAEPWELPVLAGLLGVALIPLGVRGIRGGGYGPLLVGAVASGIVLATRAEGDASLATYGGAVLVSDAVMWPKGERRERAAGAGAPDCCGQTAAGGQ